MLTAILHRKRKAVQAIAEAGASVEQTREIYGTRLLVRGLLWLSIYALSLGVLRLIDPENTAMRVVIALLPVPFFIWYLRTWMAGLEKMDELQRRIELEALGFAFRATIVFLMTVGLIDLAVTLKPELIGLRMIWLIMPTLYYVGLWRAKRRYA